MAGGGVSGGSVSGWTKVGVLAGVFGALLAALTYFGIEPSWPSPRDATERGTQPPRLGRRERNVDTRHLINRTTDNDASRQHTAAGHRPAHHLHRPHPTSVLSVVQLADGRVASASADDTVQIWDPANPATTIATYTGHAGRRGVGGAVG